jgi:hypothetical protein
VLGAVLAAGTVVSLLVVFYLLLTLRWLLGLSGAPGLSGVFGLVAAHGGAISAEVPQTPALLGLGGSLTVDPPLTTLALLPFLVLLAGSWLLSRRVGTSLVFVGALAAVYAVLLALLAPVGGTLTELGEGAELSISAAPLSAALHGFLISALGGLVGVIAARGPLLPDRARQVVKGALLAVLVSVVLAVILTIILSLVVSVPENPLRDLQPNPQPTDQQPTGGQPTGGAADDEGGFGALLATVGGFVALLPAGIGTLWLLAHGIPVGVQNVPDLGNLPGGALAEATLSAGLLSAWPFSGAWRLLLLAPVVGLVLGGAVAARGAPSPQRLLYGALIAVPYFVVVLLTAVMARIGLSISAAGIEFDTAIGAALFPWTLLVLPAAAIFGTVGAFLARPGAIPVPRPRLAGAVTAVVCALLVVGTLPLLAASTPEAPVPPAVGGLDPGAAPEGTVPEVPGPEGTTATPEATVPEATAPQQEDQQPRQPADPASSPEGEFITRYYSAAAQEDWAGTYELLSSESKAEFTQEEWIDKQSTYMDTSGAPLVQSAEVTSVTNVGSESVVNVTVTYEDGSQNVLPSVELVTEDGELRRRLTDAEIERVRSVQS